MLTASTPISTDGHHVWLFVSASTGAVDVARIAFNPNVTRFIALPVHAFNPNALMPTTPSGELLHNYRWATTTDIQQHAEVFTTEEAS